MIAPNEFIQRLKPYKPIAHKIFNLDSKNVLKLDWNESTLSPSPAVKKALLNALDSTNLERYPDTHNAALYRSLAKYAGVRQSEVTLFSGSDLAHECIINVFLNAGDTLLIFAPSYDNFRSFAQARGASVVFYDYFANLDSENQNSEKLDSANLQISESKICEQIKSVNPKMVYICNPNNPTGAVIEPRILQNIIAKFPHIAFVIDEAYFEFCGKSLAREVSTLKNLIITRTFSKAFGLASLRIGYCISCAENIKNLNKLRNQKSISTLAQIAAIAALDDVKYMKNFVLEVKKARKYLCDCLSDLSIFFYKSSANFVLIKTNKNLVKNLEQRGIFIRDYRHILPNHFRISLGSLEQTKRVATAFREIYGGGGANCRQANHLQIKTPKTIANPRQIPNQSRFQNRRNQKVSNAPFCAISFVGGGKCRVA